MSKDSKIVAEYKVNISDALKEIQRVEDAIESLEAIRKNLEKPINLQIEWQYVKNKKKWYQFWK